MMRFSSIVLAAGLLSSAATAQPYVLRSGISSDPAVRVTQTWLSYDDLEATSAAGARDLLQRIRAAATAVCGGGTDRSAKDDVETCRSAAISGAVARVRSPALTALARSHGG